MSAQHTPGPWSCTVEIEPGTASYKVVARDTGEFVADCDGGTNSDLDAANARLIAAAPELLEALQRIATAYDGEYAAKLANAAIAKVRP